MAFRFFNIGKANSEIERLEQENSAYKAQITDLTSNTPEALKAAEAQIASLQATLDKERGERANESAAASQTLQIAQAKIVALESDLKKANESAPKQAAAIQATLGQPTVPTAPASANAPKELHGIERVAAAFRAQQNLK